MLQIHDNSWKHHMLVGVDGHCIIAELLLYSHYHITKFSSRATYDTQIIQKSFRDKDNYSHVYIHCRCASTNYYDRIVSVHAIYDNMTTENGGDYCPKILIWTDTHTSACCLRVAVLIDHIDRDNGHCYILTCPYVSCANMYSRQSYSSILCWICLSIFNGKMT